MESLHQLISTDPTLFLTPSPVLSHLSRSSSQHLFKTLLPHTPKSPFDKLLVDGFDAEQIWQQIEIQTKPFIESLKREVKRFETNPDEIRGGFEVCREKNESLMSIDDGDDEGDDDEGDDDEGLEVSDEEGEKSESEGDDEEEEEDEDEEDEEEEGGIGGIEDEFLRIKDMKKYLDADEAREYGTKNKEGKGEEEDDEGDDADEDERIAYFGGDGESEDDEWENARYEDFFTKKKKQMTKKSRGADSSEDSGIEDGEDVEDERNVDKEKASTKKSRRVDASEEEDERKGDKEKENLSTYEKLQEKIDAEVKEMEKANLEPKAWTMTGEVTAAKRPKNSALDVDIDFEHNARPPPLITEEDTLSLEELIKKRVLEVIFSSSWIVK
ncbi:M phase phosphoprotein 10-like protein, partial [Drosera capensis]